MRIGGLASGMDTDQMVRDLMRAERMRVNRFHQQRQRLEWQKEDYRSIINTVRAFRDTYFDILRPTNILSANNLKRMQATASSSQVSVSANATALQGELTFKVFESATAARAVGSTGVTKGDATNAQLQSTVFDPNLFNFTDNEGKEGSFSISIDGGEAVQVTVNSITTASAESLRDAINDAIGGVGTAAIENGRVVIRSDATGTSSSVVISNIVEAADDEENNITNLAGFFSTRSARGLAEGTPLSTSSRMGVISERLAHGPLNFVNGEMTIGINGTNFTIKESDTLSQVINRINASNAGVQISYSSFSDSFTIVSKTTGANEINVQNEDFFRAIGIEPAAGKIGEAGRDARFSINGVEGTRASNTFTIDGITYTINGRIDGATDDITIGTSIDSNGIYENIEKFINDYNALIDTINRKLNEEFHRGYPPLTDDMKEGMTEREIELWENRARSGLLRRDNALENMLTRMRTALYESVGDFHLTEIGIETSRDFRDRGKLVLRNGGEDLRAAINNNPDKVTEIFSRRSHISYSRTMTAEDARERFATSGLAHRISDILNDNISTFRNSNGQKGILIERAGIVGDLSEFRNFFDSRLADVNRQIDRMEILLRRKEDAYFRKFAAMEKALGQLYSQGDFLMMQLMQGK